MDKTSKKVLKFLCSFRDYEKYAFFFNNGMFEKSARLLNMSESDLMECINCLNQNGYLEYYILQERIVGFRLVHKGIHFIEFKQIEIIGFVFKSIIVPILVSVITTLIVNWLSMMQLSIQ